MSEDVSETQERAGDLYRILEDRGAGDASALSERLLELIDSSDPGSAEFETRLGDLEGEHGAELYSELLFLLCHLRFDPHEASEHWRRVRAHHAQLQERWDAAVDLRVALASYFIHVDRRFDSPTLIEMRLYEQAREFAYRDKLTGLRNFRFFEFYLEHEIRRSRQYAWPLSLILLDIDDFKAFNDRRGHSAGNEALATIARRMADSCRKIDVPARFGGEEFAVIMPSTPKPGAVLVAERVRASIAGCRQIPGGLTVSVGLATFPGDATDSHGLVRRADQALYRAKARGKNRVHLYGESRRSHRRIPLRLNGCVRATLDEPRLLRTIDVSEGGLRFVCDADLPTGSLVDVSLELSAGEEPIVIACRVVQSTPAADGSRSAAARILELSAQDRRRLTRRLDEAGRGPDDS